MAAVEPRRVRTYGNWTRPISAGLLGLGSLGTAVLLLGLIAVIITMVVADFLAAIAVLLALTAFLGLLLLRDRHGRSGLQRISNRVGWQHARRTGSHLYRSGPLGRTPWGTYQLPGLAAASRLSEWQDSYGRPFAVVHVPSTGHHTVVFATEPDGASLVDQEQVDSWVGHWGAWLSALGNEPGLVAASVSVETAPDSGTRLTREIDTNLDPDAPPVSLAMLEEIRHAYPAGSATVKAWVALTFSATIRSGGRRRTEEEVARDLASRLPGLGQGLHSTGAGAARPVTAQELCELVRVAYDPAAARLIDSARAAGEIPEMSWQDVGPTGAEASWDSYRHDGAWSVTWAMSEAPRGEVYSSVLTQLLAPHRDIDRKRVTLLYRPMDSARSARVVEQQRRNADFKATSGRPTARVLDEQRSAAATAQEEARGANLVDFGMLVTATVVGGDRERLADVRAAVDNLSATARLQLRTVHGSQDSAFAAALPLGLVLPTHLRVPAEIRDSL